MYHKENIHFNNPNTLILEIIVKVIRIFNSMTNSMNNKMNSNKQDIMLKTRGNKLEFLIRNTLHLHSNKESPLTHSTQAEPINKLENTNNKTRLKNRKLKKVKTKTNYQKEAINSRLQTDKVSTQMTC